jgi:hypothetical protein
MPWLPQPKSIQAVNQVAVGDYTSNGIAKRVGEWALTSGLE